MLKFRSQVESDIYHVTTRGVGQQIIFENDHDRRCFGALMRACMERYEVELLAWCFMQNHVHLLPHCNMETLSRFMHDLNGGYARSFNKKYERKGHLFQSRFDSVTVECDEQFLATLRYIHQNPKSLGLLKWEDWKWSSYREYLSRPFITRTDIALEMLGGRDAFVAFHQLEGEETTIERWEPKRRIPKTDDEAIKLAKKLTGVEKLSEIAAASKSERDAMLAVLKENGFSISQISRITGISRRVIRNA